jgi:transposase
MAAMPTSMSLDLRQRIVGALEGGSSIREAARRIAVSPSAAIKLMQRVRTTGSPAPARYGGHRRPLLEPYAADLKRVVEATPDITLAELQAEVERRFASERHLRALATDPLREPDGPGLQ